MIYYHRLARNADSGEPPAGYPFSVPALKALGELALDREITVICGSNGSGKSTLMELLAAKMGAVRIGQGVLPRTRSLDEIQDHFLLSRRARPNSSFFFSAEEFIAYIDWVERTKDEARREIARIDREETAGDKSYLKMPWYRTLGDLEGLYAGDLARQSHGEGFLDFFRSRLRPKGVYLMDEPEGALTYENQYVLSLLMLDAVKNKGCQFILATHSPVLTALPGARVFFLNEKGFEETEYENLPDVQFLRLFLDRYRQMMKTED